MTDPIAIDLETDLLAPGLLAPRLVCGSMADDHGGSLLSEEDVRTTFPRLIRESEMLCGANIAYDFGVLAADPELAARGILDEIFKAYDEGRVWDVQISEALHGIAGGHLFRDPKTGGPLVINGKQSNRYSLEMCVKLVLGREDAKKNDFYRLRYGILRHVPIESWDETARQYPIDDAVGTYEVAIRQADKHRNQHDMAPQARAAWALHLASMWGLRTDPAKVEALAARVEASHAVAVKRFTGKFLREDGTEDQAAVKRSVATAYGATGKCGRCGGSGKVLSTVSGKPVVCKASDATEVSEHKKQNTCPSCQGDGAGIDNENTCSVCSGFGEIETQGVVRVYGCDGTGLDLTTAPNLPRTDKGGISASRDTCMESGDEELSAYAEGAEEKLRTTYIPFLRTGTKWPINPRPNVLLETGRSSYDGPIQQMPRVGGVRECFTARPGTLFSSVDYSAVELVTLAQAQMTLLGESRFAEVINASGDPGALHAETGARIIGASVEDFRKLVKSGDKKAKDIRQVAKRINFGLGGGMGAPTFVLGTRKSDAGTTTASDGRVYTGLRYCILIEDAPRCGIEKITEYKKRVIPPVCKRCVEIAEVLRTQWVAQWEMTPYFKLVGSMAENDGQITQLFSGRVRGAVTYTSACNGFFQSLAADGAKRALWEISKECYTVRSSPLFGSRLAIFAHDETIIETPVDLAHDAAYRQAKLMIDAMQEVCPDITGIVAEPALMKTWCKPAEKAFDAKGRLIPWDYTDDGKKYLKDLGF